MKKTYLMTFEDDPADSGYFIEADSRTVSLLKKKLSGREPVFQDISKSTYKGAALKDLIEEFMLA